MFEPKFLILSMENMGVLAMAPSQFVANAIVSGYGDSIIRIITPYNSLDYRNISWDKMKDNFYGIRISVETGNTLVELDEEHITDTWKNMRELIRTRCTLLGILESYTEQSLSRYIRYKWSSFENLIIDEIKKSDPEKNQFSYLLEEYAYIVETPVELVYKDLKLKTESDTISKVKITAMSEKWKNKINSMVSIEEKDQLHHDMMRDFYQNSLI